MAYGGYWDKLGNRFEDRWALLFLGQLIPINVLTSGHTLLYQLEPQLEQSVRVLRWVEPQNPSHPSCPSLVFF